ncbi:hypothetical protein NDU88_002287 [Pleurodeles waltl]|uniref:Uncharacterized protein n=1 Tax=Pleurodeles waltl TaxID=8319 RepID=A0AAV7NI62_PLEWA|nr:hypothetical protein NDU88_002287 [Pleurodeles waltl]
MPLRLCVRVGDQNGGSTASVLRWHQEHQHCDCIREGRGGTTGTGLDPEMDPEGPTGGTSVEPEGAPADPSELKGAPERSVLAGMERKELTSACRVALYQHHEHHFWCRQRHVEQYNDNHQYTGYCSQKISEIQSDT